MVILNNNDMFSVKVATLVADYDRDTLTNLYQPLIGHSALALYFTFLGEASLQKVHSFSNHESLLAKMGISPGDFLKARKSLEAVGLLRTFMDNVGGAKTYYYILFAPKTPEEFFNDTLLYGLLINYIGEVDAKKLNQYYASNISYSGKEMSASFKDVFHPDFENQAFLKALSSDPSLGRNRAKMKLEFSFTIFFDCLSKISQISEKGFSKEELNEILRLASLYGIDEEKAAAIVSNFYDPNQEKGSRVDLFQVNKAFQEEINYSYLVPKKGNKNVNGNHQVNSKSSLGQKINLMESVSPKDFLSILQNGTEPALPDLKLIDYLSKKFGLPNCVLNTVIDYTLRKNNNVLSKPYMEKICASLVRSGITTTVDAMNYLKSISGGNKKKKKYEEEVEEVPLPITESPKETPKEEDDGEWESLMAELEDVGDGTDDGKA